MKLNVPKFSHCLPIQSVIIENLFNIMKCYFFGTHKFYKMSGLINQRNVYPYSVSATLSTSLNSA